MTVKFLSQIPGRPFNFKINYYLAGPMTGLPKYNFPAFDRAAQFLRKENILIQSPHELENTETPGTRPYAYYIRAGLRLMDNCQGIILLPGWAGSRGVVRSELPKAQKSGMRAYYCIFSPRQEMILIDLGGGER